MGLVLFIPNHLNAQSVNQSLDLSTGWNSVWLEVEPIYAAGDTVRGNPLASPNEEDRVLQEGDPLIGRQKAPRDVFNDSAVAEVASPKDTSALADFFGNEPDRIQNFNQQEWKQWKRDDPAGISDLTLVFGNRSYLIHATEATTLTLSGKVRFFRPTWTPDRYNLIGFGLDGNQTFDSFFSPSGTRHEVSKIFSLDPQTGNWQKVSGSDVMNSGEAYWVFSSGPSNYMGPVSVDFRLSSMGQLSFGGPGDAITIDSGADALELDLQDLVFSNLGSSIASPSLDLIVPDTETGSLYLHVVSPAADRLGYLRGNRVDTAAGITDGPSALNEEIEPQSSTTLTIGAQRDWNSGRVSRTNIYRLTTGGGTAVWLPIRASINNFQSPTDEIPSSNPGKLAGLWIGQVIVDPVTAAVVDEAPTVPAAAPAPLRILMHSDDSGSVRFLSQITIMQTKSADSEVDPVPVLVADPAMIPFFEGVKERNGKKVGLRIEAVAFDMPRDFRIQSQSDGDISDENDDLIDRIVAESSSSQTKWLSGAGKYTDREMVDESAIGSFLQFRSIRPPTLIEKYKNSLLMDGVLGAEKTVRTKSGTLSLDPFHRSNPFRHAFHQNLPKGPQITRELSIVFDSDQPVSDRLTGAYSEELRGLTKSLLTVTGKVFLERVSRVATLEGAE